jgi:hypothetical protein
MERDYSCPIQHHASAERQTSGAKIFLGKKFIRSRNKLFFEMNGRLPVQHHSQMSGNPVKIRGGCATVTADKFPMPLSRDAGREGGKAV